jgi:Raf kinase inhibitor-like YbhB/YbcL family protein
MKRMLKHLLWIVPVIIVMAVVALAANAARTRRADNAYHQSLDRSIQVRSNDFAQDHEMPVEFSCRGVGISPEIGWSGAPDGTQSYALIATDWDAPAPSVRLFPVVHWVVFNIPKDVTEIAQNATSKDLDTRGMTTGLNISGETEYTGPCPPIGQHRYEFRVYALNVERISPASGSKTDVMAAMAGHVLAFGELVGLKSPE